MMNINTLMIEAEPQAARICPPSMRRPVQPSRQRLEDRQFLQMENAFRSSGGIVSADEVACRLRRCSDQPISLLARWIVERHAVSFVMRSQTLLPLFQFDPATMVLRPAVIMAVLELREFFDDWELAMWFAQPNAWLSRSAPVDLIEIDISAVLNAARADRFVAQG